MILFPSIDVFLRGAVNGLMMGCIFAINGIGFQLVFGVVKIPQFAHGSMVVWGMYLTWLFAEKIGVDPYLSLTVNLPLFFFLGYLLQRFITSHIMDIQEEMQMIYMLGFLIFTANLAELLFTANPRFLGTIHYLREPIFLGRFSFHRGLCISVVISILFLISTNLFLNKSHLGKSIRACADNRYGARITGLNIRFLYSIALGIATLLAGLAGAMFITFSVAAPWRAFGMTIFAFLVIVLGGMGSYIGAIIGGLIFGLFYSCAQVSVFSVYSEAIVYGFMFVFLLFKPAGLFGKLDSGR